MHRYPSLVNPFWSELVLAHCTIVWCIICIDANAPMPFLLLPVLHSNSMVVLVHAVLGMVAVSWCWLTAPLWAKLSV